MSKSKIMKKLLSVIMICCMLLVCNTTTFAWSAYDQAAGDAGSVWVTAEVGFNEDNVYAKVRATGYVDASMYGMAKYMTYAGEDSRIDLNGGFDQNTSGQIEKNVGGWVYEASCYFDISSDDGNWTNHLMAH